MKVWIKYLLGIALGIVASFLLPFDNIKVKEAFIFLTDYLNNINPVDTFEPTLFQVPAFFTD